jgi:hypothetical protein
MRSFFKNMSLVSLTPKWPGDLVTEIATAWLPQPRRFGLSDVESPEQRWAAVKPAHFAGYLRWSSALVGSMCDARMNSPANIGLYLRMPSSLIGVLLRSLAAAERRLPWWWWSTRKKKNDDGSGRPDYDIGPEAGSGGGSPDLRALAEALQDTSTTDACLAAWRVAVPAVRRLAQCLELTRPAALKTWA